MVTVNHYIRRVLTCYYTARLYVLWCASLSGARLLVTYAIIPPKINTKKYNLWMWTSLDKYNTKSHHDRQPTAICPCTCA